MQAQGTDRGHRRGLHLIHSSPDRLETDVWQHEADVAAAFAASASELAADLPLDSDVREGIERIADNYRLFAGMRGVQADRPRRSRRLSAVED